MDKQFLKDNILLKRAHVILNLRRATPYGPLRPKQVDSLNKAVNNDTICVLPTGYGKTLIIELLPIYKSLLSGNQGSVTIIISPLNAIITQQKALLGSSAISVKNGALEIDDDGSDESLFTKQLLKGDFKYLVGHPEEIVQPSVISIFKKAKWASHVNQIIVDEAHCVAQWHEDFRPKYRDIQDLRAMFPQAKMVALTATATVKMRAEISHLLNMRGTATVTAQIDRPNIRYSAQRRPPNAGRGSSVEESYTSIIAPYIHELKEKREQCPKTIIYVPLKWCGFVNELGVRIMDSISSHGVPEIAQFHAPLLPEVKFYVRKLKKKC